MKKTKIDWCDCVKESLRGIMGEDFRQDVLIWEVGENG